MLHAETFTVTRTGDPTPDACMPGDCSLREAMEAADANDLAETDVIVVPAGTIKNAGLVQRSRTSHAHSGSRDKLLSLELKHAYYVSGPDTSKQARRYDTVEDIRSRQVTRRHDGNRSPLT